MTSNIQANEKKKSITIFLIVYLLLLIYGTLFPLSELQALSKDWNEIINDILTAKISRADLITNSLIYIPLGFLSFQLLSKSPWLNVIIASFIAISLSFTLEFIQLYLPSRTSAISDLILNSTGGFIGSMIALSISDKSYTGHRVQALKNHLFDDNKYSNAGLLVIFFWCMSQLMPLVPSLDWGFFKNSLKPFIYLLNQQADFNGYRFSFYIFSFSSIGLILSITLKRHQPIIPLFAGLALFVLIAKIFIINRQLSPEALSGFFISLILLAMLDQISLKTKAAIGISTILMAILSSELEPIQNASLNDFIWVPFIAQMKSFNGFIDMLIGMWPYMCLAFFTSYLSSKKNIALMGCLLVLIVSCGLEYAQTFIPGRFPDISDIIMAVSGWIAYYLYLQHTQNLKPNKYSRRKRAGYFSS